MDNEGLKKAVNRIIGKNGLISNEELNKLNENSDSVIEIRKKMDNVLEELKISIIKSSLHLLIDKIHRGDIESSITILENTRDRVVFFDCIELFDKLLLLHEEYYQLLELKCKDIKDLKNNLGINYHKLHKIITEMVLDN